MRALAVIFALALVNSQLPTTNAQGQQQPPPRHGRLFPPQDLGLLEQPDRTLWQKPDQIMDAVHVADGSTVADIGAGAGWFTIRLAQRVQAKGKVYAQDVQRLMLDAIKRLADRGAEAVVLGSSEIPVLVTEKNSPIPVYDSVSLLADGAVRCAAGHLPMPARR